MAIRTVTKTQGVTSYVEVSYPVYQVGRTAIRYHLDKGQFQFTDDITVPDPDWEKLDHWSEWLAYDTPHIEKAEFLHAMSKLVRRTLNEQNP